MHGQRVGYVRVSTLDQNEERQLDQVPLDRVFTDQASGKDTQRPQLSELLSYVRQSDTVVVHSMDRLARNVVDLRHLVEGLTARGAASSSSKRASPSPGETRRQRCSCCRSWVRWRSSSGR